MQSGWTGSSSPIEPWGVLGGRGARLAGVSSRQRLAIWYPVAPNWTAWDDGSARLRKGRDCTSSLTTDGMLGVHANEMASSTLACGADGGPHISHPVLAVADSH